MDIASGEEIDCFASKAVASGRMYRGEDVSPILFGGGGWHLAPTTCCVCSRVIGTEDTESGWWFWASTNGEGRAICRDDYRRWWEIE